MIRVVSSVPSSGKLSDCASQEHYRRWTKRYPSWIDPILYLTFHLVATFGALAAPPSSSEIWLCAGGYFFRMLGLTLAFHRYFAHGAFRTSRTFQLVLALWGTLAVEKGPLWWASIHGRHHRWADTERDIHSPRHQGLLYAHFGWFIDPKLRHADLTLCPRLARYPELIWLTKWNAVPPAFYALFLLLFFGWSGLIWGFFVCTLLIWHATHCIASFAHWGGGYRRFATSDDSRNSLLLGLLLLGDGFHNNHHYAPYSARQGIAWWELDITWLVIRGFKAVGLIWEPRLLRQ